MLKEAIGTGATVELAKADAIAQLGISADSDIEIEVLEMPAKKMFGLLGTTPAKVKVSFDAPSNADAKEYLEKILASLGIEGAEIKIAETAMAVMQGADEIDVVMNLGYFLEENYDELSEEIQEIKESCRDAKLKVILETGALQTPESIQKAAVLAVYSGADFIKTSTGKGYPGATPEAVYTMCQVLKKYHSITGKRVGIKVAGGVRTAEEAVRYYTIVKEVLGNDWLNKDLFRIGASSLVEDIEHRLGK